MAKTAQVVAEEPKLAAAETATVVNATPKKTPVNERQYKLIAQPSLPPKGKQRQIVLSALSASTEPQSVKQVAEFAAKAGLQAVAGVEPSCKYHLHHLVLLGLAEVVNPTLPTE
jgi:hypothetical protein